MADFVQIVLRNGDDVFVCHVGEPVSASRVSSVKKAARDINTALAELIARGILKQTIVAKVQVEEGA